MLAVQADIAFSPAVPTTLETPLTISIAWEMANGFLSLDLKRKAITTMPTRMAATARKIQSTAESSLLAPSFFCVVFDGDPDPAVEVAEVDAEDKKDSLADRGEQAGS